MKTLMLAAALVLTLASPLAAQATPEAEVVALSNEKFKWLLAGDVEKWGNLLHPNSNLITATGQRQTRADEVNNLRTGQLKYRSIDVRSAEARVTGATAVLVGQALMVAVVNGEDRTALMHYSEVYVRDGGAWKLFHRHFTRRE